MVMSSRKQERLPESFALSSEYAAQTRTTRIEFGDFQTPPSLAQGICALLSRRGIKVRSILEPNCGRGSFILACLGNLATADSVIGVDIKAEYVVALQSSLTSHAASHRVRIIQGDFYQVDWNGLLAQLEDPVLVIGNPPWVTNAALGTMGSSNLPEKSNFQNHKGLDALTGRSNFDISEWMLIRESEWLNGRQGTLAMLCKTSVARKVLSHVWKYSLQVSRSDIYRIDAKTYFGAAVDACLLVCNFTPGGKARECSIHYDLQDGVVAGTLGFRDGRMVSDVCAYERWQFLAGRRELEKWRSGIKHDCAKVMEFKKEGRLYRNGLGELVRLERRYMYPMLKSSHLANGAAVQPNRWMLVTQRFVGEDTSRIRYEAPKTWRYLQDHLEPLNRRASSIYRGRPQFSIFGVGDYTFAPWKVATSGFYKKLAFKIVGKAYRKPVVLDDTCYFLPCRTQGQAKRLAQLLNSIPSREFYGALIFWDAKRPITVEVLRQLNLAAVAKQLGLRGQRTRFR